MLKEFREFIAKGNMLDLAVGIVIGAAFTAIVNSLVKDLLSPLIGLLGKANFADEFLLLRDNPTVPGPYPSLDAATKAGAVTFNYGSFITAVINFLIVAFVIFAIVKAANKLKRSEPAPAPAGPSNEEKLLIEIRDAIRAKA